MRETLVIAFLNTFFDCETYDLHVLCMTYAGMIELWLVRMGTDERIQYDLLTRQRT